MIKIADLLISQYYNSPKMRAVIQSLQDILQSNIGDSLDVMKRQMGIKAEGIWLDFLAARFAIKRPLVPDGVSKYFGLVTNEIDTNSKGTFSQAPFVPDGRGRIAGKQPSSDSAFRIILAMRCAALASKCTHDELLGLIERLLPDSFILDNQDMTGTLVLNVDETNQNGLVIKSNIGLFPRPSGVSYTVMTLDEYNDLP